MQSNGRELDEGERVAVEVLPVLGQSAALRLSQAMVRSTTSTPGEAGRRSPSPDPIRLTPWTRRPSRSRVGQHAGQGGGESTRLDLRGNCRRTISRERATDRTRSCRQRETAVAILNVDGGDDAVHQQALRTRPRTCRFLRLDQLAGIEAQAVPGRPPVSDFHTLTAIRCKAVGLASRAAFSAALEVERMMDAIKRAVPVPRHENVIMHGASRLILGQRAPLDAGSENVHPPLITSRKTRRTCRRRACPKTDAAARYAPLNRSGHS